MQWCTVERRALLFLVQVYIRQDDEVSSISFFVLLSVLFDRYNLCSKPWEDPPSVVCFSVPSPLRLQHSIAYHLILRQNPKRYQENKILIVVSSEAEIIISPCFKYATAVTLFRMFLESTEASAGMNNSHLGSSAVTGIKNKVRIVSFGNGLHRICVFLIFSWRSVVEFIIR